MFEFIRIKIYLHFRKSCKFRKWLELEEVKEKIIRAIDEKSDTFPDLIFSYLSIALNVSPKYFAGKYWEEVINLFYQITIINLPPRNLPIISETSTEKTKKDTWDYEGRTWHLYSHLLAKSYGWSLEYIADLSVVDALAKIQEILTDEQLEREFTWGTSENAYSYNPNSKTSKFVPLPRPYWMQRKVEPPKTYRMPIQMLPVGSGDYAGVPEEFRPKEIKSNRDLEGL